MKLCIPVCVSFDCNIPDQLQRDPYILVGCGGYTSSKIKFTDSTGKNMSKFNQYINEMSMLYWMHFNYETLGNPDYIGLAQYRRILQYDDWMLQPNSIVCTVENCRSSIYSSYCLYHVKNDFDFAVKVIKDIFPEKFKSFTLFCDQSIYFGRNLFIMHRDKFIEYSKFMCKLIDVFIEKLLPNSDITQRDKYQKRAIGFLLERLTGFWIYDQMMNSSAIPVIVPVKGYNIQSPYQRP